MKKLLSLIALMFTLVAISDAHTHVSSCHFFSVYGFNSYNIYSGDNYDEYSELTIQTSGYYEPYPSPVYVHVSAFDYATNQDLGTTYLGMFYTTETLSGDYILFTDITYSYYGDSSGMGIGYDYIACKP